jgi:hypothetical protein
MSRSPALARVMLSSGRWLLPWLSLLLVSASLAFAMTSAVSGSSRAIREGQRQELAPTPVIASLPPSVTVAEGNDSQGLGRSCASLFGSYNGWLFSSGGHGPCGLEPNAGPGSPPDQ